MGQALFSCNNTLDQSGDSVLNINITTSAVRSMIGTDFDRYIINCDGPGSASVKLEASGTTVSITDLISGVWHVTVSALDENGEEVAVGESGALELPENGTISAEIELQVLNPAPTSTYTATATATCTPTVPKELVTVEAEDNPLLSNCRISSENSGFSGDGYVDMGGEDSYFEFDANVIGGPYLVFIVYANGGTTARPLSISTISDSFEIEGLISSDWSDYISESKNINLSSGLNTIRITANTSAGGPNVDKIIIQSTVNLASPTPSTSPTISPSPTISTSPTISPSPSPTPDYHTIKLIMTGEVYDSSGTVYFNPPSREGIESVFLPCNGYYKAVELTYKNGTELSIGYSAWGTGGLFGDWDFSGNPATILINKSGEVHISYYQTGPSPTSTIPVSPTATPRTAVDVNYTLEANAVGHLVDNNTGKKLEESTWWTGEKVYWTAVSADNGSSFEGATLTDGSLLPNPFIAGYVNEILAYFSWTDPAPLEIINPGAEEGLDAWTGDGEVNDVEVHSGASSFLLKHLTSLSQEIDVSPQTNYTLTAWVYVGNSDTYLQLSAAGQSTTQKTAGSWQQVSLNFNSGLQSKVLLTMQSQGKWHWIWVDDLEIQ